MQAEEELRTAQQTAKAAEGSSRKRPSPTKVTRAAKQQVTRESTASTIRGTYYGEARRADIFI